MNQLLYSAANIVTAIYDQSINSIVVTWIFLGPHDHVRPCVKAQLECVQKGGAKAIVVDTSRATGTLKQEEQQWFAGDQFPALQAAGLRAIITVLPANELSRLTARQWKNTGQQFDIEFIETGSLILARELARKYAV